MYRLFFAGVPVREMLDAHVHDEYRARVGRGDTRRGVHVAGVEDEVHLMGGRHLQRTLLESSVSKH